jgi:hypothetical protein
MKLECTTPILGELSTGKVYYGLHIPMLLPNGRMDINVVLWSDKNDWGIFPLKHFKPAPEENLCRYGSTSRGPQPHPDDQLTFEDV